MDKHIYNAVATNYTLGERIFFEDCKISAKKLLVEVSLDWNIFSEYIEIKKVGEKILIVNQKNEKVEPTIFTTRLHNFQK